MVSEFIEAMSTRKRGRPLKSPVRERLKEMLYIAGSLTAYEAHKYYIQLFSKASQRNIYYQLQKGVSIGMFRIYEVKEEKGDYSWGPISRKVYYELADRQGATINESIQEYFQELKANSKIGVEETSKDVHLNNSKKEDISNKEQYLKNSKEDEENNDSKIKSKKSEEK